MQSEMFWGSHISKIRTLHNEQNYSCKRRGVNVLIIWLFEFIQDRASCPRGFWNIKDVLLSFRHPRGMGGGKWRCAKCINDCKQATFAYKCAFRTFLEKYLAGGAFLHKLLLKSIGTIWNGPNFRWLFSGRARLGALPAIAVLGATCATLLIPQQFYSFP